MQSLRAKRVNIVSVNLNCIILIWDPYCHTKDCEKICALPVAFDCRLSYPFSSFLTKLFLLPTERKNKIRKSISTNAFVVCRPTRQWDRILYFYQKLLGLICTKLISPAPQPQPFHWILLLRSLYCTRLKIMGHPKAVLEIKKNSRFSLFNAWLPIGKPLRLNAGRAEMQSHDIGASVSHSF